MTTQHRLKRNAVFLYSNNTLEHELWKCRVAYELRKAGLHFITEAVDNRTGLRRDVVCLDTGDVFEIVCSNDGENVLRKYRRDGVYVVYADWNLLEKQVIYK